MEFDMPNSTCSVDGCDREHSARGFCGAHYNRSYRGVPIGGPLGPIKTRSCRKPPCLVDGCEKRGNAGLGLCRNHRYLANSNGDPTIKRKPGAPMGDEHPLFKGEDIGYTSAHMRTRRRRGSAKRQACAHCGLAAQHWAVTHDRANLFDKDLGLRYSADPADYIPLCVPCHSAYDRGHIELDTFSVSA